MDKEDGLQYMHTCGAHRLGYYEKEINSYLWPVGLSVDR